MKKFKAFILSAFFLLFSSCSVNLSSNNEKVSAIPEKGSYSAYFSPRGGCTRAIINEIKNAEKSINVVIYSFTSKKLAKALIKAHEKGVKVEVIIDRGTVNSQRSVLPLLIKAKIPVKTKKGSNGGLMHHKYAVIDNHTVITGSFNWTVSAEKRNDENLLIIKENPELANLYLQNFKKLWRLASMEE